MPWVEVGRYGPVFIPLFTVLSSPWSGKEQHFSPSLAFNATGEEGRVVGWPFPVVADGRFTAVGARSGFASPPGSTAAPNLVKVSVLGWTTDFPEAEWPVRRRARRAAGGGAACTWHTRAASD